MTYKSMEAIEAKIESILKEPTLRAVQLSVFAESLDYIAAHGEATWLTHVLRDRIRLFAGRLIVVTITEGDVWVTTAPEYADRLSRLRSWRWDTDSYPQYKRPPSRNGYYSPAGDTDRDWPLIREAHVVYLNCLLARNRRADPRSVARHEPLMVEYLRREGLSPRAVSFSEEVADPAHYWEGATLRVSVNRFERDRATRDECLRRHGYRCTACKMSFVETYGPEAKGLIHVHHVIPLSEIREGYSPDPASDLKPICPNCHAVIHAAGSARTVKDVRSMLGHATRANQRLQRTGKAE